MYEPIGQESCGPKDISMFCLNNIELYYPNSTLHFNINTLQLKNGGHLMFEGKSQGTIRRIIIQEQSSKCNHCGISEWRGAPITLELEHKDGDNRNNERSNLECICPNCHSQTSTWRGRNKGGGKRVSDEDMIAKLRDTGSMHQTLMAFGLAAKGGNYVRVKRLVAENDITVFAQAGVGSVQAKLSHNDLANIFQWKDEGKSYRWIATTLGVDRKTVTDAHQGKTYKNGGSGGIRTHDAAKAIRIKSPSPSAYSDTDPYGAPCPDRTDDDAG
jgi:Zn finger protein HypA/HybF involved in hydrogenase expression